MFQNIKILLVEDELLTAKVLIKDLSNLGYKNVWHANSDEKALAAIRKKDIEFIIMDVELTGSKLDGIQLAEQIRTSQQIPTLFLSNHSSDAILDRLKNVMDLTYELKPVNPSKLDFAIRHILKRHTLQEEENDRIDLESSDVFFVKSPTSEYRCIRKADIRYFEANNKGTTIYHGEDTSFIYHSLGRMAEKFKHLPLVRTHNKYAVAIDAIRSITDEYLILSCGKQIAISRGYKKALKVRLEELMIST